MNFYLMDDLYFYFYLFDPLNYQFFYLLLLINYFTINQIEYFKYLYKIFKSM